MVVTYKKTLQLFSAIKMLPLVQLTFFFYRRLTKQSMLVHIHIWFIFTYAPRSSYIKTVDLSNVFGRKVNLYQFLLQDVKVEVSFDTDTFVGQDVMVKLQATNTSKEQRTLDGLMTISTMYYTGVVDRDDRVGQENIEHCVLQPGESEHRSHFFL